MPKRGVANQQPPPPTTTVAARRANAATDALSVSSSIDPLNHCGLRKPITVVRDVRSHSSSRDDDSGDGCGRSVGRDAIHFERELSEEGKRGHAGVYKQSQAL
ncbi:unnamed protein product [Angiostrongylus costaricensis]|uniref:Uncharacterized protein n=1 Tax=Angiostrongylus costaricensis TaxID=334426 RepID=A0A0R3PWK8_ANGCS|nr:unnamed protein product [Angiostrongylus costaricensis]